MDYEVFGGVSVEESNNIAQVFLESVRRLTNKEVIIYEARNIEEEVSFVTKSIAELLDKGIDIDTFIEITKEEIDKL